jgi:putative hydrolase of the HAD superfamily
MAEIKYLLFDAANTLIHKPALWERIESACAKHDLLIDNELLRRNHKMLSELIAFPDRTDSSFYKQFNRELLYSCGVLPSDELLADIFESCSYLPWEPFPDTAALAELPMSKGILSNFSVKLESHFPKDFAGNFSHIITSEQMGCAKPDILFYEKALELIGEAPDNILYIGDSIKLDMEPARILGMQAKYSIATGGKINSFLRLS